MTSRLPVAIFLLPFVAGLVTAAAGWLHPRLSRALAIVSLVATAALSLLALSRTLPGPPLRAFMGGWRPPLGIEWALDPLGAAVAALVAILALGAALASGPEVEAEVGRAGLPYHVCALLLLSGLMGMIASADLFNVFVHLEVASLTAYALVASGGKGAPRAAMAYLVMGSLGASFYLLGVGYLYAATGTLNMADVAARLPGAHPRLVSIGMLFIVVGLGVKMGLFPLHGWMPNAYCRSPSAAASLMAPLVTKVAAYALVRVLFWVFGLDFLARQEVVLTLLRWTGMAALLWAGVMACVQTDLRRMLAYSSISQMGIVAMGVGLANRSSMIGALFHIGADAFVKALLFLAAGAVAHQFHARRVADLERLRGRAPWTQAAMVVGGLSLVGIPPLPGFFGKWYVLAGAIQAGNHLLAGVLVLGSLVTAAYVFRLVEKLFFAPRPEGEPATERPGVQVAALVTLSALVVALGIGSERLVSWVLGAAVPAGVEP